MENLPLRIRQRMTELGMSQVDLARSAQISTARLGNYVSSVEGNQRNPDLGALVRLARALRTTTDWLLGINESAPVDAQSVVLRLLELDGMRPERAQVIAAAVEEALQLLSALPNEGAARTRALLAAQAAWHLQQNAKRP